MQSVDPTTGEQSVPTRSLEQHARSIVNHTCCFVFSSVANLRFMFLVQGISTYDNPIDTHHRELYKLHLAQKTADIAAAQKQREHDNSPAAKQKRQPIYGAREKCGDAFWWGATYKSWLAKKSGTEGSSAFHVRRKWEKRYFALQVSSGTYLDRLIVTTVNKSRLLALSIL